jgi:hypothetical protein
MKQEQFFTFIEDFEINQSISSTDKIFALGSCFASEMGNRFKENKWEIWNNEIGVLFNPYSIFSLLIRVLRNEAERDAYIEHDGKWFHYDWHSNVFGKNKEDLIKKIEEKKSEIHQFILSTDWLIFTFGTAIVRKNEDIICANCHKQPKSNFSVDFLDSELTKQLFSDFYSELNKVNPNVQMVFTVSPIRHTKEGLIKNARSKAILLESVHKIVDELPDVCQYFPSFEIMIDMLRDYRFYKSDMIHPSDQAVDIIWTIFSDKYFSIHTQEIIRKQEKLSKMEGHKFSESATKADKKKWEEKYNRLKDEISHLRRL